MREILWQELKIGNRVSVTAWPLELKRSCMHVETISAYEYLIKERIELIVHRIDELGIPFGKFSREFGGNIVVESIGLNHSMLQIEETS